MDLVNTDLTGTGEVLFNNGTGEYTMVPNRIQELPAEYPIIPLCITSVIYSPDETLKGFIVLDGAREYKEVASWYPRFSDLPNGDDELDELDEDDPRWHHWDDDEWLEPMPFYVPAARMFFMCRVLTVEYLLTTNLPLSSWVPGYREVTGDNLEVLEDGNGNRMAVRSTTPREQLNRFDEANGREVHIRSLMHDHPGVRAEKYVRLPGPHQMNG